VTLKPGRELRHHNNRIMAERLNWPDGVLDACHNLEDRHPGWSVGWLGENTIKGFERPAGYIATRAGLHPAEVFAATEAGVEELIKDAPPAEHDPNEYCPFCAGPRPYRARL